MEKKSLLRVTKHHFASAGCQNGKIDTRLMYDNFSFAACYCKCREGGGWKNWISYAECIVTAILVIHLVFATLLLYFFYCLGMKFHGTKKQERIIIPLMLNDRHLGKKLFFSCILNITCISIVLFIFSCFL